MQEVTLGIDVACRADHVGSLADTKGEIVWSNWHFGTRSDELDQLWAKIPDGTTVTVVMEPTRNAWVPLAAWFQDKGATVSIVPPEQSADLRDYYNKHTKTDSLDSRMLARMPLLHPEGLRPTGDLGPADPLKRAVRHRTSLQKRRTSSALRLDALIELLGPAWADAVGCGDYNKSALAVLSRFGNPHAVKKLGRKRLTTLLVKASRGAWREAKADEILMAADETLALWPEGAIDFDELAADIATEVAVIRTLDEQIDAVEDRIEVLYEEVDPTGIVASAPGIGVTLAAGILGRTGDLKRFDNLAGVRSFSGLVPKTNQSGTSDISSGITKSGDPGLRTALFLAVDHARKVDPTLAEHYKRLVADKGKHHNSALCTLAATLLTRIAACWRNNEVYVIRNTNGDVIDAEQGRKICADEHKVTKEMRAAKRPSRAKTMKKRAGRDRKESTEAAPVTSPPSRTLVNA